MFSYRRRSRRRRLVLRLVGVAVFFLRLGREAAAFLLRYSVRLLAAALVLVFLAAVLGFGFLFAVTFLRAEVYFLLLLAHFLMMLRAVFFFFFGAGTVPYPLCCV